MHENNSRVNSAVMFAYFAVNCLMSVAALMCSVLHYHQSRHVSARICWLGLSISTENVGVVRVTNVLNERVWCVTDALNEWVWFKSQMCLMRGCGVNRRCT